MTQTGPVSKMVDKLASEAALWYNGGAKNCVPSQCWKHSKAWIHSLEECIMNTLPPHAKIGNSPTHYTCWKCYRLTYKRGWNKTTNLCFWCWCDLLDKIMRHKKRARTRGNEATLTTAQWAIILHLSQGHCYYCHQCVGYDALILEHRIPISKGGGTTPENVVPACASCNGHKGVEVWV